LKIGDVKDVIIWGNHSNTQYPDASHAKVNKGGKLLEAPAAVGDDAWLKGEFLSASSSLLCASLNLTVQKRGAIIIEKRKLSSAMSAAKAACDHVHDWFVGTKQDEWVSMAVPSDGSYDIPAGLVFSFPVTISPSGEWKIVRGLAWNDFAKEKIAITLKELEEERDEALKACESS
uniref:Ldh_1_C domain-containing protein n=1 Tax=Ascaris lumbricoides TaxID=6252 RepID=A0A0M3IEM5_ASCLU